MGVASIQAGSIQKNYHTTPAVLLHWTDCTTHPSSTHPFTIVLYLHRLTASHRLGPVAVCIWAASPGCEFLRPPPPGPANDKTPSDRAQAKTPLPIVPTGPLTAAPQAQPTVPFPIHPYWVHHTYIQYLPSSPSRNPTRQLPPPPLARSAASHNALPKLTITSEAKPLGPSFGSAPPLHLATPDPGAAAGTTLCPGCPGSLL